MTKPQELIPREAGQVVAADAGTIMAVISRAASDPSVDVAKLERLTALYERIKAGEAKAAYMDAFANMQAVLPVIEKRGRIAIGKGKPQAYALWNEINDEIKPVLERHGFGLSFRSGNQDGKPTVTGILSHRAGHSEETTMVLPIDSSGSKNAVQAIGSSTSYGKRYVAGALLNLTFRDELDDDGKAAGAGLTISDEAVAELYAKVEASGADLPKFLAYFKIATLEDLPAKQFDVAVQLLEQRARAKK